MLSIKEYRKASSLEEAYEWNQKKSSCVLGGMLWLKMQKRKIGLAIDLSDLGLDVIEEDEQEFRIGAMVTLRQMETHKGIHGYSGGAVKESLKSIVGVQFRNGATVGGTIFSRFGFSDLLTVLLAMDVQVELHQGGRISLEEFTGMVADRDILVRIIVKKTPGKLCYLSQRNTKTDFPVLTCAVSLADSQLTAAVGARPGKATVVKKHLVQLCSCVGTAESGNASLSCGEADRERLLLAEAFAEEVVKFTAVGSNMRASAAYRAHLVKVLVKRGCLEVLNED